MYLPENPNAPVTACVSLTIISDHSLLLSVDHTISFTRDFFKALIYTDQASMISVFISSLGYYHNFLPSFILVGFILLVASHVILVIISIKLELPVVFRRNDPEI